MDTDVDFAGLVKGQESLLAKTGPGTRTCQALVKSIDAGRKRITAVASAPVLDRDGEIIEASAFAESLPGFMRNPVVLASHQHRLSDGHSPVVANVTAANIMAGGLEVEIEFHEETELAREYWGLYSKKIQRALSVGFMPKEGEYKNVKDARVWCHTRAELLEISCVPVGSCPEALSRSAQKKLDFVAAKRSEREDEQWLAEMREEDPDFDRKREEFGDAMLLWDDDRPGYDSKAAGDDDEYDFVELVRGGRFSM
ncbi:MAG TPA: HK97 family phage prohead protease [Sedimentisphaerales bacterium]|nr:HK97 family phage prohead protease [Sedimentisphaerales bacterium]